MAAQSWIVDAACRRCRPSSRTVLLARRHGDERGFFLESFRENVFAELGIPDHFVQDNHSRSRRGIVRGMHYQPGQAKLVRCVRGAILDVLVDIRPGSPQFGQWEGFQLDDIEHHQLYCPGRLRPRLLRAQRGRRRHLQDLGLLRPAARGRLRLRRSARSGSSGRRTTS